MRDVVKSSPTLIEGCERVRKEVSKYQGWDVNVMVAISKAESNCRDNAVGDNNLAYWKDGVEYGRSYGAFQIRHLPGRDIKCRDNLENNVRCAYGIYQSQGLRAWSVYNNGSYKKFVVK